MRFTGVFFLILTWTAMALRFYTRFILAPIAGMDDWIALASLVRTPCDLAG
jgi:hypothetical protein